MELESALTSEPARMASRRVETNTILPGSERSAAADKEYARKMESLAPVHDGSTGQVHASY